MFNIFISVTKRKGDIESPYLNPLCILKSLQGVSLNMIETLALDKDAHIRCLDFSTKHVSFKTMAILTWFHMPFESLI